MLLVIGASPQTLASPFYYEFHLPVSSIKRCPRCFGKTLVCLYSNVTSKCSEILLRTLRRWIEKNEFLNSKLTYSYLEFEIHASGKQWSLMISEIRHWQTCLTGAYNNIPEILRSNFTVAMTIKEDLWTDRRIQIIASSTTRCVGYQYHKLWGISNKLKMSS